jgi:hypothetical protein
MTVVFDAHQYALSAAEEALLREDLDGLARQVERFPIADLRVVIEEHPRSRDITVKLVLVLPGETLVTTDHDAILAPAFERALTSLLDSLDAYKNRLGNWDEQQKLAAGTLQQSHPSTLVDMTAIEEAAAARDYAAFRAATLPYEEDVRARVGRWVQRYPDFEARLGVDVKIADVVEETFLLAFESFDERPSDVPLSVWLEGLIDAAIKTLRQHGDELENIELARTARAAEGQSTLT